jgi:hypothetical protein
MRKALLAGCALLSVLYAPAAHAIAEECATVLKTPDGFPALREEPTVQSKMVAKLREGNFLRISNISGRWTRVTDGWVYDRYIRKFPCPIQVVDDPPLPGQPNYQAPPKRENVLSSDPEVQCIKIPNTNAIDCFRDHSKHPPAPPVPNMGDAPDWLVRHDPGVVRVRPICGGSPYPKCP